MNFKYLEGTGLSRVHLQPLIMFGVFYWPQVHPVRRRNLRHAAEEINSVENVRICMTATGLRALCWWSRPGKKGQATEKVGGGAGLRTALRQAARCVCGKQFQLTCWNWNRTPRRRVSRPASPWMLKRRRRGRVPSFLFSRAPRPYFFPAFTSFSFFEGPACRN